MSWWDGRPGQWSALGKIKDVTFSQFVQHDFILMQETSRVSGPKSHHWSSVSRTRFDQHYFGSFSVTNVSISTHQSDYITNPVDCPGQMASPVYQHPACQKAVLYLARPLLDQVGCLGQMAHPVFPFLVFLMVALALMIVAFELHLVRLLRLPCLNLFFGFLVFETGST
jgi:hypothetical protein